MQPLIEPWRCHSASSSCRLFTHHDCSACLRRSSDHGRATGSGCSGCGSGERRRRHQRTNARRLLAIRQLYSL